MNQLQIIVCIKQVPDPEGPVDAFKVDPEAKKVIPVGISPFINPFDENALEAALRIKDNHPSKITVVSLGENLAQPVLRKALAAGADDLILLIDSQFKDIDSYSTGYVLSSAIKRIGTYDLILTGRQSSDWGFGVTGLLIAEMLQIPIINLARKVEIKDDRVLVEKLSYDGYEVVEAPMPVLVIVSNEVGELRYSTSVRALQAASKKPVKVFNAENLELDHRELTVREIFKLFAFHSQRECKFIDGGSSQEKGENLAIILKKEGVI
jgi:electron transfer flavoprotein beta subunit